MDTTKSTQQISKAVEAAASPKARIAACDRREQLTIELRSTKWTFRRGAHGWRLTYVNTYGNCTGSFAGPVTDWSFESSLDDLYCEAV